MTEQSTFNDEQQALVDKLVGEARVKAREKAQVDFAAQAAKDKDATSQAALVAEKKWQELAEKHEARVKELEPLVAKSAAFDELVAEMLKDRTKALGDAAKKAIAALPEGLTDLDKLNWLNENESLFEAARGDGIGTPGRPKIQAKDKIKPGEICKYPIRL